VIDRPAPVNIDMAEREASDLLLPLGGQHHRRLAGQPVMEEAGTGLAGLQRREDRQEESPGKIQFLRWPDRPDRELACGTVTAGDLPAQVRARASYGPETCAQAANLVSGHYIPVHRSTMLLCQLAGIAVSTGWMAGIRGRAAALVEASGFMERVRELLKTTPAVHADQTPARAAGGPGTGTWPAPAT
jgi:transposase